MLINGKKKSYLEKEFYKIYVNMNTYSSILIPISTKHNHNQTIIVDNQIS